VSQTDIDQPYVFISYASADRERVLEIVAALRDAGIACWLDQHNIAGGTNWGGSIAEAIEGCAAIVLMSSAASLASRNVRQELALAWQHEKSILPLLLDATPAPNDIAYWLATAQWLEVLDHSVDGWLPKVGQALARLGLRPPASTASPTIAPVADMPGVPAPLTPTVGRETEIAEISTRLRSTRLLTLLGPGGTGKTRLAQEVARRVHGEFPDGVVWVDLTPIASSALVTPAIAAALKANERGAEPPLQTLARTIGTRSLLLVLDNMEHVVEAAADVSTLLRLCPNARILATSRVRLRVTAEQDYPVSPLALPEPDAGVDRLSRNAAVALFVQRAQAVRPAFALTSANAAPIAAICRRLDGLPLALELAAARIAVLTPRALLERLDRPLDVLRGGARDLPERQRTIRATIQWSFDLLTPEEQRLLRRLSIFVGGWTLEAAETVVRADGDVERSRQAVLDGLTSLVEKSLVTQREQPDGELRFGMLETIRELAREQLDQHGEVASLQRAHATYFLHRIEQVDHFRHDVSRLDIIEVADQELHNLRAAIRWGLAHDIELAARLLATTTRFWLWHGRFREGFELASAARAGLSEPSVTHARLLEAIANFDMSEDDLAAASVAIEEAVGIARAVGDTRLLGEMLQESGDIFVHRREVGHARARYEEALPVSRALADRSTESKSLMGLGAVAFVSGAVDEAMRRFEEALALARSEPVVWGAPLTYLADALLVRGEQSRAIGLYREVLTQPSRLTDQRFVIRSVEGIARVIAPAAPGHAATLVGAARAERDRMSYATVSVVVAVAHGPTPMIEEVRRALGEATFAAAWERGRQMALDEAVALALELTDG
jgi:predicted ATPase